MFDLRLSLVPHIRAKDWDQHSAVNTNCEQNYKGKEENHWNRVCTTCNNKAFICCIVITDVKQSQKSPSESTKLPCLSAKQSIAENCERNENGSKGHKKPSYQRIRFSD